MVAFHSFSGSIPEKKTCWIAMDVSEVFIKRPVMTILVMAAFL